MFCKNCGQNVPEGSKFCKSCGAELTQSSKPAVVADAVQTGGKRLASSAVAFINTRINVNTAVKSPLIFALVFGVAGIILSLVFSFVLDAAWGKPLKDAGREGQAIWAALGFSGSFLAVFLRSLGTAFSTNMDIEITNYGDIVSMTLSLTTAFRIALLLIIPLLAIVAARTAVKSNDSQNMTARAALNSLWIGLFCAVLSLIASHIKIKNVNIDLYSFEIFDVYQKFSLTATFAWAFAVSLILQFLCGSGAKRGGAPVQGYSDMIGNGIRYGLGPVKQMAVSMGILSLVLVIVALISGGAGEIFSKKPFAVLLIMLSLIIEAVFKLTCFVFGIPLALEVSASDIISSKAGTYEMSVFGFSYGSTQESLPLIAISAILFVAILFLIQYYAILSSHSQKNYWISGGVSLAAHCGILLILARFSSTIIMFQPPKEFVRLFSTSSRASTVFFGMKGNFLYMLLIPVAIYLLVGFLCNEDNIFYKICASLYRFKIPAIAAITVLFALSVYASRQAVAEGIVNGSDLLRNIFYMLDRF